MAEDHETPPDACRPSEATRLRSIITNHRDGVAICAISGAGGIGKSYLVEHVVSSLEPANNGWMVLRIDASQAQARGDFFALIDGQLARRSLAPPADPRIDYFPETRRVAAAHRDLIKRVRAELERNEAPEDVKRAAVALLKAAHLLNKAIPKTREYLDVAKFNLGPDKWDCRARRGHLSWLARRGGLEGCTHAQALSAGVPRRCREGRSEPSRGDDARADRS